MSEDYAGLGRDQREEGGGMIDDLMGRVKSVSWVEFVYKNKAQAQVGKPTLALAVSFEAIGDTKLKRPIEENYSGGDLKFFRPSKDGKHIVRAPGSTRKGLSKDCHAALFLDYAEEADPNLAGWKDGVSVLVGREVHLVRKPFPSQQKKDNTKLAIVEFLKGGTGTGSTGGGADVTMEAQQAVMAIAKEAGAKGITKAKLSQALFKSLEGNPARREISQLAMDSAFLTEGAKNDLWNFDTKVITSVELAAE